MAFAVTAPPPPTKLGRYRQLAPRAGVHVSPICLGGMNIGDKWAELGMGSMDKESSFKLLDAYYDAGGNFIDTASNYQDGSSEQFIGEWAEKRGIRDQLVICTKYSNDFKRGDTTVKQHVSYVGNSLKALKLAFETSLKNLRTSYIDVFYLHFWDLHTDIEEIMDGLHTLVLQGKVLYLGVSDTPAWLITKANAYARHHGKTPFVVCQAAYSVVQRDIERDLIPMCQHEGIALTLWNVLATGHIRSDAEEELRRKTGEQGRTMYSGWERTPDEKKMCDALEVVAKQVGTTHISAVAIAYVMHKAPYVFPVIGGRKIEHLQANIEALSVSLTSEQIGYIDGILPFDVGFPSSLVGKYGTYSFLMTMCATFDHQPLLSPIAHTSN